MVALWMGTTYEELLDEEVLTFELEPDLTDSAEQVNRPRLL